MRIPRSHSPLLSLRNDSQSGILIWKHPEEDFNTSSVLTVQPAENAIFLSEGKIAAVFTKEGRYELETNNRFFTGDILNLLSKGESTFTARLFFVRLNESKETGWGFGANDPVAIRDPKLHIATELAGYGSLRIRISDAVKLMTKLISFGIDSFTGSDLMDFFGTQIRQTVKSCISQYLENSDHEILGITSHLQELAGQLSPEVATMLDDYGIQLANFSIGSLTILKNQHRERVEEGFAARQEADIIGDKFAQVKGAEIASRAAGNPGGAFLGMMNAGMAGSFGQILAGGSKAEPEPSRKTLTDKLRELKEARDAGLINDQEFEDKRNKIINEF